MRIFRASIRVFNLYVRRPVTRAKIARTAQGELVHRQISLDEHHFRPTDAENMRSYPFTQACCRNSRKRPTLAPTGSARTPRVALLDSAPDPLTEVNLISLPLFRLLRK